MPKCPTPGSFFWNGKPMVFEPTKPLALTWVFFKTRVASRFVLEKTGGVSVIWSDLRMFLLTGNDGSKRLYLREPCIPLLRPRSDKLHSQYWRGQSFGSDGIYVFPGGDCHLPSIDAASTLASAIWSSLPVGLPTTLAWFGLFGRIGSGTTFKVP